MKHMFAFFLLFNVTAPAQPLQADMNVFAERRANFMKKMEPRSAAIFPCKPEYLRNLDVEFEYRQESNFYYLSGFEESESVLLLNPAQQRYQYVLFVRRRDPRHETYEGPRAGVEGAMALFKADTALFMDDFEKSVHAWVPYDGTLYYTFGINPKIDDVVKRLFVERRSGAEWPIVDPAPVLAEMRIIKNEGDFRMGLQKAIDISAEAHREAMKSIRPGMYEYEVQAVFEYVYRKNGSPRNSYPCIIGSGPNSGTLHYEKNSRKMNDGDVVLMDCAAEYGYYGADITRTVPVNGKFTREQREIYQIVLDAQNAAMRLVKPGLVKTDMDRAIDSVLGNGLVRLGLIKEKKDFRIFTPHGYSHWIGLEVHDVGSYTHNGKSRQLEPGMVFTIEPGIYVRADIFDRMKEKGYTDDEIVSMRKKLGKYINIGVRIEDDVLVTENGWKNLSASAPREIAEIEAMMKENGIGKASRQ
jgi:Xaa-Pro aminopeptidase